ncbi:MAG: zinc-binding alcohol dehydrogenase [Lautropia sp.]
MRPDDADAFWIVEPGRGEIRRESLGALAPGMLRVRTRFSGISRGTETLVFHGEVPASEHRRMRAPHQSGDFPGPVKYGYCSVGRIEDGPPDWHGREVFCLFPHQSRYDVAPTDVHPLPPGVPPSRAVLAANLETAVNVLWDAGPAIGDRIAIVGAGVVGLLVGWLAAKLPGAEVRVVDVDPAKAGAARALGLGFSLAGEASPTPAAAGGDADLVVHASGQPAGLVTALSLAGPEATIVEASWYGTRAVALPLGEAFHSQRLTLRASQVGALPPSRRPRWDHRRRLGLALRLLAEPALDVLVTGESPLEAMPSLMASLPTGTLCHRIRHHGADD